LNGFKRVFNDDQGDSVFVRS